MKGPDLAQGDPSAPAEFAAQLGRGSATLRSGLGRARALLGTVAGAGPVAAAGTEPDPQWYRDAVIYEVHVRSFQDSNGDGIGDFRGLTQRLDYLCDLGVTALWLLPFYPSPLRDDGYDIADYTSVNPTYGTLRDAEKFIREAHRRGLRVITELVCNHTSDQHPWFQRARHAKPGSAARDFYVWSDTPDRYPEARIIFKDFETSNWSWDPVAGAYYWHRFYAHQPDLNFDNPRVRAAITRAMDFWLDRGVDGLRLDAVPYLFERDGTDCENLPETHAFLRDLRRHVDERYRDRMLLAEANQWPDDAAAYFGAGDECHMAFNFPVMPRMFMAIQMEDRRPIVDIVEQTPAIPDTAQWALFLRNHDELTLEMVTDEERDYMYRVYAGDPQARVNAGIRRRLAPLLGNHRRRLELMNGLLFSLPGTPVIYYGDEIGMGDNVYLGDRDSVRTPMQWSGDRNAGFSTADREQLYLPVVTDPEYSFEAVNVAVLQANPHSLLWWLKRLIALRKRHPAFARGDLKLLHPENRHVLAFLRCLGDETVLVAANLSRYFQPVELDLAKYEGRQPVELFGRIRFPRIAHGQYSLSLGPHEFLWFTLEPVSGRHAGTSTPALPGLRAARTGDLVGGKLDAALVAILLSWIQDRDWYRGRGRLLRDGEIVDRIEVPLGAGSALMIVLEVAYSEGDSDTYLIPLTTAAFSHDELVFADGSPCRSEPAGLRVAKLASADVPAGSGFLVDATFDPAFNARLIEVIARRRRLPGAKGELAGHPGPGSDSNSHSDVGPGSSAGHADVRAGSVLQLRRVLESAPDPEAELIHFLTDRGVAWMPPIVGELEYVSASGSIKCAAFLRVDVPSDGEMDMAALARHALVDFLERAAAVAPPPGTPSLTTADLLRAAHEEPPEMDHELIGPFLESVRSIGGRIGELHAILASSTEDPAFAPEHFTRLYQRSLYQSIDAVANRVFRLVAGRMGTFDGPAADDATVFLGLRGELRDRLRLLLQKRFGGERIRIHGALRPDTLLHADRGPVTIDMAGDTTVAASERRLKRSPLRDVASMIHSFHDLALGRLRGADVGGSLRVEDADALDVWARRWFLWVSAAFLRGYRDRIGADACLPAAEDEWVALLDAFRVQVALGDLVMDFRNGQDRVPSSIRGLLELLGR
jgi:maltose alpha-D-glucosyltransferase/alpha-amylase